LFRFEAIGAHYKWALGAAFLPGLVAVIASELPKWMRRSSIAK
jgi:hypothetical protein